MLDNDNGYIADAIGFLFALSFVPFTILLFASGI